MPKKYIIGTRGSLLALTQCSQVKEQLENLTGDTFELKVIQTQGDQKTDKPLWQYDGKDFFTKELDQALVQGEVDLVVHSYKDLGTERPAGIQLAAITKRQFPHDILLIKQATIERLPQMKKFVVGTSSPRRITNITANFGAYLPTPSLPLETKILRGNVNTRIEKLQRDEYDAIVLAMAGLERLAMDAKAAQTLKEITTGLNFFVMPQNDFPAAAAQGALGIECARKRNDDGELLKKLQLLNDADTIQEVELERKSFTAYGGGCHLAVGINVKKWQSEKHQGLIEIHRGKLDDTTIDVTKMHLERAPRNNKKVFLGLPHEKVSSKRAHVTYDQALVKTPLAYQGEKKPGHYLVTSQYCLEALKGIYQQGTIWAAGTRTAKAIAAQGFWVNGATDALGERNLEEMLDSQLIRLLLGKSHSLPRYTLTYEAAKSHFGEVVKAYEKHWQTPPDSLQTELKEKDIFYWTSFDQFQKYLNQYPWLKEKTHACGLGKTYQAFLANEITPIPFANMQDLNQWLDTQD